MDISDQRGTAAPGTVFTTKRMVLAGRVWGLLWPILFVLHVLSQLRSGLTDGVDRPFGEDFINFWSGARLANAGHVASVYDFGAFHDFQVAVVGHSIDLYHYSYPPTLLLLTAPFAWLPYPVAWVAWQALGWLAFATALRRMQPRRWALIAWAWPAVLINAISGQAGCWIAAIIGWGLVLLPTRPLIAGLLLSLLTVKPQLAWLVPLALLARREWRPLVGMMIGAVALPILATIAFGPSVWAAYAEQAATLKRVILEDGTGTWHRMISVFVLVRHVGAPLSIAYAAQAMVTLGVAWLVLAAWYRGSPMRGHLLVMGMLLGSIYVSDYDLVMLAFPAACLWAAAEPQWRAAILIGAIVPLVAAVLAVTTHVAFGALMLWPMLFALRRLNQPAARPQIST